MDGFPELEEIAEILNVSQPTEQEKREFDESHARVKLAVEKLRKGPLEYTFYPNVQERSYFAGLLFPVEEH